MHNKNPFQNLARLFSATQTKLVYAFAIASVLFVINFGPQIVAINDQQSDVPDGTTSTIIVDAIKDALSRLSELQYVNDIASGFIYVVAAVALYIAYIFISNSIVVIKNELIVDTNYAQQIPAGKIIKGLLKRIVPPLLFVIFVLLSIVFFADYWLDFMDRYVAAEFAVGAFKYFLVGLVGLALNIYLILAAAHYLWLFEEEM